MSAKFQNLCLVILIILHETYSEILYKPYFVKYMFRKDQQNLSTNSLLADGFVISSHSSDMTYLARMRRELDSMSTKLGIPEVPSDKKLGGSIWHSYRFGHGSTSRDALTVKEIRALKFTGSQYGVQSWHTTREAKRLAVGITNTSLVLCRFGNKLNEVNCNETVLADRISAISVFSINEHEKLPTFYVVCALFSNYGPALQWYEAKDGEYLEPVGAQWQLRRTPIKLVTFVDSSGNSKLVMLNENQPHQTADLYDFNIIDGGTEIWMTSRLKLNYAHDIAINVAEDHIHLSVSLNHEKVTIYKLLDNKFEKISDIISPNVTSLCAFEIEFSSFLAISGELPRVVKIPPPSNLKDNGLIKFKNDSIVNNWVVITLPTYRRDVMLLAEHQNGIEVLSWNLHDRFVVIDAYRTNCVDSNGVASQGLECMWIHGLRGAAGIIVGKEPAFLLPTRTNQFRSVDNMFPALYQAIAALEHVPSPSETERNKIFAKRVAIQNFFDSQSTFIKVTEDKLKKAINTSSSVVISAPWFTTAHLSAPRVEVSHHLDVVNISIGGKHVNSGDWENLKNLEVKLQNISHKLKHANNLLQNALKFDPSGNLEISTHLELNNSIYVEGKTDIKTANIIYLNEYPVIDLMENIVRLGHPKTIGGVKEFDVLEVNDLVVTETLNGQRVVPFLNTTQSVEVDESIHFAQSLTASDSKEAVSKSVKRSTGAGMGAQVKESAEKSNTTKTPQHKTLHDAENSLHIHGNLEVTTINGVNFKDFIQHLIPNYAANNIHVPGETYIKSCKVNNLWSTYLNGLLFPEDYVLRKSNAEITGYKYFTGKFQVDDLHVINSINSIPVEDFVTLDTDQELSSSLTVHNFTVNKNLLVHGVVDSSITNKNIANELIHTSNIVFHHLNVANGIKIKDPHFLDEFLFQDNDQEKIVAPKHFKGKISTSHLHLHGLLNSININDLFTRDTTQIILGNTKFTHPVIIENLDVDGTIQGIDWEAFYRDAVKLSSNQTAHVNLTFTQPIDAFGLHIHKLNNLDEHQFVTLTTNQKITAPYTFEHLKVEHLTVNGIINATNHLNGKDLSEIDKHRVSRHRNQTITGSWVADHSNINGSVSFGNINKVDVKNIQSQGIVNKLQDFGFAEELHVIGNIGTQKINDFDLKKISDDAVLLAGSNHITGALDVKGPLKVDSMSLFGTLNGGSLEKLSDDIVTRDQQHVVFTGLKSFSNGAHVHSINGKSLNNKAMDHIFTKTTDQTINVPITFSGRVELMGYNAVSLLNDVPIEKLMNSYSYKDNLHTIFGNVMFLDKFTTKKMTVDKEVQGLNIENFFSETFWLHDTDHVHTAKTFVAPALFESNLDIRTTLNGVDVSRFVDNVAFINKDVEIKGLITFLQDVYVDEDAHVNIDGNLQTDVIMGCKPIEWKQDALYIDNSFPILGILEEKHFESISSESSIKVEKLNEVDFDQIILLHQDQIIPALLTFESVSSPNNVDVGGKVNSFNIEKEYRNTLMVEGDQKVTSKKVFNGDVTVRKNVLLYQTVNNYKIDDIVTLYSDQQLFGTKIFDDVEVMGDISMTGPVSGVDWSSWKESVVLTDSPLEVITGHWNVNGNVTFLDSVNGPDTSLLDNTDVHQILNAKAARDLYKQEVNSDKIKYCQIIKDLLEVANRQSYTFKYLEEAQFLPLPHPVLSYTHAKLGFKHEQIDILIISMANECKGRTYVWNKSAKQFTPVSLFETGEVNTWVTLPPMKNGDIYLISAGSSSYCTHNGGNLWLLQESRPLNLQHVQSLGNWTRVEQSPLDPWIIYSLDDSGILTEWKYSETQGLVLNKRISVASSESSLILNTLIMSHHKDPKSAENNNSVDPHFSVTTAKQRARVRGKHDDIKIYEGNFHDGKLFHRLPVTNPGSVHTIQFNHLHATYIAFIEDHLWLKVYRYEGLSGFTETASVKVPGAQLYGIVKLPSLEALSLTTYLVLFTSQPLPGVKLLEMHMLGDPAPNLSLPDMCYYYD